jgi:hypothetical protein
MLDIISQDDFSGLLHTTLQLRFGADVRFSVELVEVRRVENYSPLERQPFAIVVRSDQQTHYYHQNTFTVEHPERGDLDIFFVPVGFDGKGVLYEAVFS